MFRTKFHKYKICVATLLLFIIPNIYSFELPFLKSCTVEDEQCHIEQAQKFFDMYGNGIKELDVPTLDPMHLGDININGNSNENFNLQLFMENVDLFKHPQLKVLSFKGFNKDPTKSFKFVMKTLSPQLIVKAHCRVKGKLLLFTINGETDLILDVRNVTTTTKGKLNPYTKDDKIYYKAVELKPKLDIGKLTTKFENSTLFNGEEVFMETFADTINENWEVLRDEIEPKINDAVAKVEIIVLNKVLETIPSDKYFKD